MWNLRADSWESFSRKDLENMCDRAEKQINEQEEIINFLTGLVFKKCHVKRFFNPVFIKTKCCKCRKEEQLAYDSYEQYVDNKPYFTCWDCTEDIPF